MESGISWQRNLVFIWLSQFFSIMAFGFALPFVPYYLQQDLGVVEPLRLQMFIALFGAAAPFTFAIFAPIWGAVADRYGRRLMLLRANLAGVFVIGGMGLVHSPWGLIFFRVAQGCLTGTVSAAQTMVAVHTPGHRSGVAFGALSASIFCGSFVGNTLGGFFAEWFGYRNAFYAGAGLMVVAVLLIMVGVRDVFEPPVHRVHSARRRTKLGLLTLLPALPILGLIAVISLARFFDGSILPLLVQEIQGGIEGAASRNGMLNGVAGVAGFISGIVLGRLADRVSPPRLAMVCAVLAGLAMLPQGLARSFPPLFVGRFLMAFFAGGLDPVFQIWLSRLTAVKRRGFVFGWAASAKSMGWMFAPLGSGTIATFAGVRWVYAASFFLFMLLVPAILLAVRRLAPPPLPQVANPTPKSLR